MQSLHIIQDMGSQEFLIAFLEKLSHWFSFWMFISNMLRYQPHIIIFVQAALPETMSPFFRVLEAYETYVCAL